MNLILFGEDIFTATVLQSLLADNHLISAVICPFYKGNREYESLQKAANENHIPFLHVGDVNSVEIETLLKGINPDLIISVHLKRILFHSIYSLAAKGAINVHPSLLPKYRGLSPQHQVLLNGESITGVTIHFIDEKPDTGDIIIQEEILLGEGTSIFDLHVQMLSVYKYLVTKAVKQIESNHYTRIKQDDEQASWYGQLKYSDRKIDFKKLKTDVYNLIRAVSKPYSGAYHNGVTIWTSSLTDNQTEKKLMQKYPEVGIYREKDLLIIRLIDGILLSEDFESSEM